MSAIEQSHSEIGESLETRKVRVTRLDPWSVAKSSFVLGVTIAGVIIVATVVLWLLLSAAGVLEAITGLFQSVSGDSNSAGISFLSLGRLVGLSMVISAIEIVLLSVLSVIFAVLYNLSVGFTGGIEVSVSDIGEK
jgi:Transmembrane domain of unknown function (DUF3566)